MKSLCIFCGSSSGNNPDFLKSARSLGQYLAENRITLIYGGANVGIMGVVADSTLESGGSVIGVLPKFLQGKEIAHTGLTELILCETMHERKMKMFELSHGFIALPGGFGTLEEVVEILTWQQLGFHKYPVGFLNIGGFFNHLKMFFDEMERTRLLRAENKKMALFGSSVPDLLKTMKSYKAPEVTKWISSSSV
ncbi:MAG: TIGR00730 family Rossman fold protein [Bdellovibrionales bacterium]|nr:TIGR00730 family Rossman fold protein [Bdellovibrionales bacterium]